MTDIPTLPVCSTVLEYLHRLSHQPRPWLEARRCESGRPPWLPRVVTLALTGRLAVSHLHSPPFHTWGHWHLKAICSTRSIKKQRGGGCQQVSRPFVLGTSACPHKHIPLRARAVAAAEQVLCFLDPSWGNNTDLNPNRNRSLSSHSLCLTTFVCVWGFVTSSNEHLPVTSGETGVRDGCDSRMPGLPLLLRAMAGSRGRHPRG